MDRFDTATLGAGEIAAAVADGRVSAREACEQAIARIEARDGAINAVVVRDFERARAQADARDAARLRGERGPLLGVPMTVKESLDVAGLPTTWGLPPFSGHRPSEDAVVVQRLKAAGAVVLGKTNVPPSLGDWQSANPIYGRTVNPHDASRTPGGSSGGSAAALASGLVPLEIGSDIGGSLRVPAAFCGVFALKPTFGLVPSRGHGFPQTDGAGVELAVTGPMARSASDLALALDVIAGPDLDDGVAHRLDLPPPRVSGLAGARLVFLDRHPSCATDRVLRDAVAAAAARAAVVGAEVAQASEALPDLAAAFDAYVEMLTAIVTRGSPGAATQTISAHRWFELLDIRHRLRRRWRAFFERFDGLVTPAFGTLAYPHLEAPDMRNATLIVDGQPASYGRQVAWPSIATFPGLPSAAMPVGRDAEGLPIGLQVTCGWMRDRQAIALAEQLAVG